MSPESLTNDWKVWLWSGQTQLETNSYSLRTYPMVG